MIKPVLQDEAFLEDVARAREDRQHVHLWWLGQSGYLLQWQNHHLLIDPYLSDSLTTKYAGTKQPHVRMTARVVAPECLDFVDVVTSSHAHTDHLDPETLKPLQRVNPSMALVIPEANRELVVERLGLAWNVPIGLDAGRTAQVGVFRIHAVPAAHNELEKDELGRHKFLGYVIEAGSVSIYHSGDTLHYPGMEVWLQRWTVDLALLPINGHVPERGVAGNLNGREAAKLAKECGVQVVIPCHYDMFQFNTASPAEFVAAAAALNQRYRVLECGQRWSSKELE